MQLSITVKAKQPWAQPIKQCDVTVCCKWCFFHVYMATQFLLTLEGVLKFHSLPVCGRKARKNLFFKGANYRIISPLDVPAAACTHAETSPLTLSPQPPLPLRTPHPHYLRVRGGLRCSERRANKDIAGTSPLCGQCQVAK